MIALRLCHQHELQQWGKNYIFDLIIQLNKLLNFNNQN